MANEKQLQILGYGGFDRVTAWNDWREKNPNVKPDLSGAHLINAMLQRVNLSGANLSCANLRRAHLYGADLSGADLSRAVLVGAKSFSCKSNRGRLQ